MEDDLMKLLADLEAASNDLNSLSRRAATAIRALLAKLDEAVTEMNRQALLRSNLEQSEG